MCKSPFACLLPSLSPLCCAARCLPCPGPLSQHAPPQEAAVVEVPHPDGGIVGGSHQAPLVLVERERGHLCKAWHGGNGADGGGAAVWICGSGCAGTKGVQIARRLPACSAAATSRGKNSACLPCAGAHVGRMRARARAAPNETRPPACTCGFLVSLPCCHRARC